MQDGITEKFQALIIEMSLFRFVPQTWVSQRFGQQERIAELVADAFLERIQSAAILSDRGRFDQQIHGSCLTTTNSALLINGERRDEIDRALCYRIVQCLARCRTALRCLGCFQFRIRSGKQGGFIQMRTFGFENEIRSFLSLGWLGKFRACPSPPFPPANPE